MKILQRNAPKYNSKKLWLRPWYVLSQWIKQQRYWLQFHIPSESSKIDWKLTVNLNKRNNFLKTLQWWKIVWIKQKLYLELKISNTLLSHEMWGSSTEQQLPVSNVITRKQPIHTTVFQVAMMFSGIRVLNKFSILSWHNSRT